MKEQRKMRRKFNFLRDGVSVQVLFFCLHDVVLLASEFNSVLEVVKVHVFVKLSAAVPGLP